MEELSYLKIHPRDQEENKLLLFRCERLYEESTGEERQRMEYEIRRFESALNTQDRGRIEEARSELKEFLKDMD